MKREKKKSLFKEHKEEETSDHAQAWCEPDSTVGRKEKQGRVKGGVGEGEDSMLEVRQEIHGINPIIVECAVSAPAWQEQGGEEKPSVGRSCAVWHCPATGSTRERGWMCAAEESRVQPPWVTQGGAYLPWEVEPPLER